MLAQNRKPRIAVIVSHPIQHFCPMYASWAKQLDWETKVFFASAMGAKAYSDKGFGKSIVWKNLYLESFDHVFLNAGNVVPVGKHLDAPEFIEEISNYDPDVVVIYGYSQKFQQKAFQWAKRAEKKIFYISDTERAHDEPSWKWWLKKMKYRSFFRRLDCCLSVGNHNEHYYTWMGVPMYKINRLGFSIDRDSFETAYLKRNELRQLIRSEHRIPERHIVVSVVGKLIGRKRQADIILALKKLETLTHVSFSALIIGSGPDQEKMEVFASKLTTNQAIITGFIAPEQLTAYYSASDIYTHLSEYDPHTLSVGEAIYMGCPIVVSDKCGVYGSYDDVQPGKNGFIYPCGDIDALAYCLLRLGEQEELRRQFGEHSRMYAVVSQSCSHENGLRAALIAHKLL